MTLDALYMRKPAGTKGLIVERLGPWTEPPVSAEERARRAKERWARHRVEKREERTQYMREWRARKAA